MAMPWWTYVNLVNSKIKLKIGVFLARTHVSIFTNHGFCFCSHLFVLVISGYHMTWGVFFTSKVESQTQHTTFVGDSNHKEVMLQPVLVSAHRYLGISRLEQIGKDWAIEITPSEEPQAEGSTCVVSVNINITETDPLTNKCKML